MGDEERKSVCSVGLTAEDVAALKDLAQTWQTVKHKMIGAVVLAVVGAVMTMIGLGIKAYFSK